MVRYRQQTDEHQRMVLASEVAIRIRGILDTIVGASDVRDEVRTEAINTIMMAMDAVNSQTMRPGQQFRNTHLLAIAVAGVEANLLEPEILVDMTRLDAEVEEGDLEPISTTRLMALQALAVSHPVVEIRTKAATQLARLAVALALTAVDKAGRGKFLQHRRGGRQQRGPRQLGEAPTLNPDAGEIPIVPEFSGVEYPLNIGRGQETQTGETQQDVHTRHPV